MIDLDFSTSRAQTAQAVAFNLGDYCNSTFETNVSEALRGIPDTEEGSRVAMELYAVMQSEYHAKAVALIATGDRAAIDAIYRAMFLDIRERVRVMDTSGRLHQRDIDDMVNPLVGAGRQLTSLGHNSYSVQALKHWMATRLPAGTDIEEARVDGSFLFTDGSTATLDELIEASRPISFSPEGWREQFPTPEHFAEALAKHNRRRVAEFENQHPWSSNGLTSRDGRFRAFRDMQS